MLLKCCTQYASKFEKLSSGHRTRKISFHSNPKEGQCQRMFKLPHNYNYFTCYQSNAQNPSSFNNMWTKNFQIFKLDFKRQSVRDQINNILWITEKTREFQNNIYFCIINYTKAFDSVDHYNCGKIFKRLEYQPTLPVSCEICMQVKKQQLEPVMEQWTGSKLGKKQQLEPVMEQWTGSKLGKESRLYIVTLLMQLTCRVHHVKCQAWWSTNWNKGWREKYQ